MVERGELHPDYSSLLEMGFSPLLVRKALIMTGYSGIESAIGWISENQDEPEPTESEIEQLTSLNSKTETPVESEPKKSEAEKEAKIKEYERILAQKREQRSKQEEIEKNLAERERRKIGREAQNFRQKKKEDDMLRAIEQRNREKKEDEEYMKRLKLQIELEKKERFAETKEAANTPSNTTSDPSKTTISSPKPTTLPPKKTDTSTHSRIQVILPNSERLVKVFGINSNLSEVYDYVYEKTGRVDFELKPSVKIDEYDPLKKNSPLKSLGLSRGASFFLV